MCVQYSYTNDILCFFFFFFKQKTAYEMLRSLVGSEMCIRDSINAEYGNGFFGSDGDDESDAGMWRGSYGGSGGWGVLDNDRLRARAARPGHAVVSGRVPRRR
eukprot:TRINITY_DN1724_c0_g1_i1.p2 TRINITY_DN1724_c0_g1~~TRINITY_DN1724_c0_g1_i1.p2  ORF type:complete len:103 (+),score=22.68 TRINITY_DN1724_c0_g1_i1:93-401(+)